jgi:ribA/ribD-fused uncharacterized protein
VEIVSGADIQQLIADIFVYDKVPKITLLHWMILAHGGNREIRFQRENLRELKMSIEFWAAHKSKNGIKTDEYDDNFYLSNFYAAPIEVEYFDQKIKFKTSEHLYQAMKFFYDQTKFFQIVGAKTPKEAANLGRTFSGIRDDWEDVKDGVMYDAVMEKFKQNPFLKEKLLATGDEELIEASPKDKYWGRFNGEGLNMLGKILMMVREKIK